MIIIISCHGDSSTTNVIRWLIRYNIEVYRINFSDFVKTPMPVVLKFNSFERVVNPGWRVFHYSSPPRPDGTYRITVMGNYKKNYFKTAGLQVGDEIVMLNDSLYKDVMSSYNLHEQLWSSDTLRFDILRNGQPLRIAVPVDKSEEQGD